MLNPLTGTFFLAVILDISYHILILGVVDYESEVKNSKWIQYSGRQSKQFSISKFVRHQHPLNHNKNMFYALGIQRAYKKSDVAREIKFSHFF